MGPCACGRPGARMLAATTMCEHCYHDERTRILATIPPYGRVVATAEGAPPGWQLLACIACGATWVAPPATPCPWCAEAVAGQRVAQARLERTRARSVAVVPGFVWCPEHGHVWAGVPAEVCGVHGGPYACNRRGVPLPRRVAMEYLARERAG